MLVNELYQRERHKEFSRQAQREAEQARMIGHAHMLDNTPKPPRKPFYKPALSAVGVKLVALGNRLQDNVETVTSAPTLSTGNHA